MQDGKVRIQVTTNAAQASKDFNALDKSLSNAEKSAFSMQDAMNRLVAYFGAREIIQYGKEVSALSRQFDGLVNKFNAAAGSAEVGAKSFEFVKQRSDELGLSFLETAQAYAGFEAATLRSGLTLGQTEKIFNDVSAAIVSMHLSAGDANLVFLALEQMASKGVVSTEELRRQLGDKLPGAFEIAAKSMGMTTAEFNKFVGDGKLMSAEFLPKFSEQIRKELGGSVESASKQAQANFNRLQTEMQFLGDAVGDELNPTLSKLALILTNDLKANLPSIAGEVRVLTETFVDLGRSLEVVFGVIPKIIGTASKSVQNSLSAMTVIVRAATLDIQGAFEAWDKWTARNRGQANKDVPTLRDSGEFDKQGNRIQKATKDLKNYSLAQMTAASSTDTHTKKKKAQQTEYDKEAKAMGVLSDKLLMMAMRGQTNTDAFKKGYQTLEQWTIKTKQAQDAIQVFLTPMDKFNNQIERAQKELGKQVYAPVVNMEGYKSAKDNLTKLMQQQKKYDDMMRISITPLQEANQEMSDLEDKMKNIAYSASKNGWSDNTKKEFAEMKKQYLQLNKDIEKANSSVTNAIGMTWRDISSSIASDLSSALTTPLKEGENAFERFGNVAINTIQKIAQKMLETKISDFFNQKSGDTSTTTTSKTNIFKDLYEKAKKIIGGLFGDKEGSGIIDTPQEGNNLFTKLFKRAIDLVKSIFGADSDMGIVDTGSQNIFARIFKRLGGMLGSLFGGGTLFSAKGNAFNNGNVIPFAKGGIVDKPTGFSFSGGLGIAGEAGTEAILPLRRNSSGDMGVSAVAPVINIINNAQVSVEVQQRSESQTDIVIRQVNAALQSRRTESSFNTALNRSRGIQAS